MTQIFIRSIAPGTQASNGEFSIVGHAWIEIHHPDGQVESYGFYPIKSAYSIDGFIEERDGDIYRGKGFTSDGIAITNEQLNSIRLFAESVDQYGTWELFGGDGKPGVWNCSTWSVAALAFADVSPLPLFAVAPWFLPLNLDNSYPSLPDAEGWGAAAMNAAVYDHWQAATTWTPPPPRDPLAIDLDGDGLETVGVNTGRPVLFDHNADGLRTATGWVRGDDAWLVLDRDGNGLIDSGRELFGEDTVLRNADGTTRMARNGFDALRSLDANADGVFNAADPAFTQVRLWQDLNQDGISQPAELQTLQQQRITANLESGLVSCRPWSPNFRHGAWRAMQRVGRKRDPMPISRLSTHMPRAA